MFTGMSDQVGSWLDELERTPAFYFDAITQLEMAGWSRGRVTLVGDAGVLRSLPSAAARALRCTVRMSWRTEMARAGGDYAAAFASYER